jgi:hypothetical protein
MFREQLGTSTNHPSFISALTSYWCQVTARRDAPWRSHREVWVAFP